MQTTIAILVLLCASSAQEVIQPWQIPCREEIVQPNLVVNSRQHIFGRLKDSSGAPLENSKVLLRKLTEKDKFVDYRSGSTDKNGRFDLKLVERGRYRFLPAPNRGWRQPESVVCSRESDCELRLVVALNSSDQPFAGCPLQ
jgi:hypothetical protein